MRRIEAGEAKLNRNSMLDALLARKVGATKEPWNCLTIDYTCLGDEAPDHRVYTIENDRALICMTVQVRPTREPQPPPRVHRPLEPVRAPPS